MPHHILGEARALDQRVEVDASLDAKLLAQEHEILGADVAGRAGIAGERAAAQTCDRRVEAIDAHLEPCECVRDAHTARVVQV